MATSGKIQGLATESVRALAEDVERRLNEPRTLRTPGRTLREVVDDDGSVKWQHRTDGGDFVDMGFDPTTGRWTSGTQTPQSSARLHERQKRAKATGSLDAWIDGAVPFPHAASHACGGTDPVAMLFRPRVVTPTVKYDAVACDGVILCDATAAGFTVTLPTAASMSGRALVVKKIDASAHVVTIDGNGAETIDGAATVTTATQYEAFRIVSDGAAWWKI